MKKLNLLILFTGIVLSGWVFEACNNGSGNNNQDSVDSAKNMNDSSTTSMMVDEQDSRFAVNAADINMAEIEMGRTAEQKATHPRVKSFASMMVMDHTKASNELKSAAAAKNIVLPSTVGENHQDHLTKLSQKTGRDFDKEYMDMMVDGHQKAIDLFEKEANDGKDADLKTWANNTLPSLRQHLDSAKAIRDMLK